MFMTYHPNRPLSLEKEENLELSSSLSPVGVDPPEDEDGDGVADEPQAAEHDEQHALQPILRVPHDRLVEGDLLEAHVRRVDLGAGVDAERVGGVRSVEVREVLEARRILREGLVKLWQRDYLEVYF